jgi:hypothetical protein
MKHEPRVQTGTGALNVRGHGVETAMFSSRLLATAPRDLTAAPIYFPVFVREVYLVDFFEEPSNSSVSGLCHKTSFLRAPLSLRSDLVISS